MTTTNPISELHINEEYKNAVYPLTEEEYNDLRQSIIDNGLWEEITVNEDYIILDGHHRYWICLELGIEPKIKVRKFPSELHEKLFVIEGNRNRRQLTDFQMIELELDTQKIKDDIESRRQNSLANLKQGPDVVILQHRESEGRLVEKIAKKTKKGSRTVSKVKKIKEKASEEVLQKLRQGKISIHKEYKRIQNEEKRQELINAKPVTRLPENCKLLLGDFLEKGNEITDNSTPLIFTDPPYDEDSLPLYDELGKLAMRVLLPGGSLVTNLGEGYTDIVIEKLKASGLKFWTILVIKLEGNHTSVHFRKVFAYCKILLWFVKGDKLREGIPSSYMPNFVVSSPPEKLFHTKGWGQSPVEAEHVIKYVTFPGEIVLDPMMGEGTTGIAALNQGRQFIGIEIDQVEYTAAKANIIKSLPLSLCPSVVA